MADEAASKAAAPVLTPRDQELMVTALLCLENNEIKIDFVKFATESGFKDKNVASSKWGQIKRKIDSGAKPSATTGNAATKATSLKTPRKTPATAAKTAVESRPKAKEVNEHAVSDANENDGVAKTEMDSNGVNETDHSTGGKIEMNDEPTVEDADGDSTMIDTPDSVDKGESKASVADSMSSGEMSPPATPAPTKAKKKATKVKATPSTPKTPTGVDTTSVDITETLVPSSSVPKKRGRKPKAQKEAEAAATGENNVPENGNEDEGEKPAKKPRKTPVKKAKKEEGAEDGDTTVAGENGEGKEKVTKKPRKTPVKKAQKEDEVEESGADASGAKEGEDEEKEELVKKSRKNSVKKTEAASPTREVSPTSEPVKEKKKPGPKPGPKKATKASIVTRLIEPEATDETYHEENDEETSAKVVEAAKLANAVIDSKKIRANAASTTEATVSRDWGKSINSPSPTKSEVTTQIGSELATATAITIEEAEGDTIVVAPEVVDSIEMEEDDGDDVGDTIAVAAA